MIIKKPDSIATRINDCKSEYLITADEGLRGGKIIELKKIAGNLDEILALSPEYKTKEIGFMQFTILFYIFDHIKEERKNAKTIF